MLWLGMAGRGKANLGFTLIVWIGAYELYPMAEKRIK